MIDLSPEHLALRRQGWLTQGEGGLVQPTPIMRTTPICDACESVSICLKKGCIPALEVLDTSKGGGESTCEAYDSMSRAVDKLLCHIACEGTVAIGHPLVEKAASALKAFNHACESRFSCASARQDT